LISSGLYDQQWVAADRFVWGDRHCDHEAVWRLHDRRVRWGADVLRSVLRPVERFTYWCCGVDETENQPWHAYAVSMLFFGVSGFVTLYGLLRLQWYLPFNPQTQAGVESALAFNTSVSFVTNTNWQSYVPETTMGYLVQMAGLTVHNFVSAAVGIALAIALIRGFAHREASGIGNFWVDLTRCTLYILLPISVLAALLFIWQGVPQNLSPHVDATTLEGTKQTIAQGPVASQSMPTHAA
jgi:potassium-transporting ATPase potassium-binding subunit